MPEPKATKYYFSEEEDAEWDAFLLDDGTIDLYIDPEDAGKHAETNAKTYLSQEHPEATINIIYM